MINTTNLALHNNHCAGFYYTTYAQRELVNIAKKTRSKIFSFVTTRCVQETPALKKLIIFAALAIQNKNAEFIYFLRLEQLVILVAYLKKISYNICIYQLYKELRYEA